MSGCNLSVDTSLIRGPDAGSEDDGAVREEDDVDREDAGEAPPEQRDAEVEPNDAEAEPRDAQAPEQDASVQLDAQGAVLDASGDADLPGRLDAELRDAQVQDVVAPEVDARVTCSRDGDCAADSFCTAAKACVARCNEQSGCAGPPVSGAVEGMAVVGDTIYWSTPIETDSLGNPLNHGRIWSWRRGEPWSSAVQRDSGTLLFVIDDYIYFLRPSMPGRGWKDTLLRKWLGTPDSPAEQLATWVRRVWKTRDHIVWSRFDAAFWHEGIVEELWRLRRMPNSTPEHALSSTDGDWMASNATFAIKIGDDAPRARYEIVRFSDRGLHGTVMNVQGEPAAADEDYLYFVRDSSEGTTFFHQIMRVPFSDLSQQMILAKISTGTPSFVPNGGWLYWYSNTTQPNQPASSVAGRSQRDVLVPPQALPSGPPYAAATKNDLVYVGTVEGERHIFIKAMPPLPCSALMPCPSDMSCGASMLCE